MSRIESELTFCNFDLQELLSQARRDFPALSAAKIDLWFREQPALACIATTKDGASIALRG